MNMNKIEVKHISKTLDELPTLADISLTVGENEIVVVLGPSGCGKSTLLNIIAGLLHPDRGRIIIEGEDWTGKSTRVSYMQQKDLLLDWRSILDNVTIPLLLKGMPRKQARAYAANYFEDFGLQGFEDYYPRQLSGGMRQRAALLRTYLFASDILLLDEPFAALDAITRRKMQLWLLDLYQRYKSSILFVTHDIEEALLLADRIYILGSRPAVVRREILWDRGSSRYPEIRKEILEILEEESNGGYF
ncbi:MAG: ABC transporter ATP-binding protein [Syntrophomonadaceae bacterium]|jgi:ABC-type nitrate/sulfonate/bicarbonate transport system ATPase subunit|nr:ABC transporter ATP-binding protein [Syntrophomonadaceae bacterium]